MSATFDVFTKRTRLFYAGLAITIVSAIVLGLCGIYNVQYETPWEPLFDALIIIASFTSLGFVLLMGTGIVRTYYKDGELVLADDHLVINGVKIKLNEAKAINLKVSMASIKTVGNMLGNRISLTDSNNETYQNRFVVRGYNRYIELENILNQWRANGVAFSIRYHNF
ncbi:hypothetical protein [Mucilaginibacter gotjawali]|uniref:Uncharacterized protein n=2 Tax=Mucilaginibacter gotjawali TaxID=1550579 RepID=A0A120MY38_9SPHI|nr:hypothetical protein [Mucilaginibacter gotjawali]MBB3057684.1 hypothetical protein [Mucilaginibacter gotjawali]BAU52487.1 hypothetical protein MgSA37_00648 [Mucilaginibacter gotjawali]